MNAISSVDSFLFGEDVYRGGGRYGPITRPRFEFVLVQRGAAQVNIDGSRCQLIEGYAALILSQNFLCFDYRDGIDTRVVGEQWGQTR